MSGLDEAVEVGAKAALAEAMGHNCTAKACRCDAGLTCDYCLPRIMRPGVLAALPEALRAVVAEAGREHGDDLMGPYYSLDNLLAALARLTP